MRRASTAWGGSFRPGPCLSEAAASLYHRATGRRLEGKPGTPGFLASYEEAGRAAAQARSLGTMSWLIREYCAS